jgi:hypothetical protein
MRLVFAMASLTDHRCRVSSSGVHPTLRKTEKKRIMTAAKLEETIDQSPVLSEDRMNGGTLPSANGGPWITTLVPSLHCPSDTA